MARSQLGSTTPGRPAVAVSLGTLFGTPGLYDRIIAAAPQSGARVIAATRYDVSVEDEMADAVADVLENPVYGLNAERLQREIEEIPSVSEVVPSIEKLATDGPPSAQPVTHESGAGPLWPDI